VATVTRRTFDPIQHYATTVEVAALRRRWATAERDLADLIRRRMDMGLRAQDAADMLGWSRASLYRWLKANEATSD